MREEAFETLDYKGYQIKLYTDDDPMNPRLDTNVGTMVCFHKRYVLGDAHTFGTNDFKGWSDMKRHLIRVEGAIATQCLYLYDHSGITISTTPFSCPWDSGQVGFIYATRKSVEETLGIKRLTKASRAKILQALQAEVKVYDTYLRGDFCGYVVEKDGVDGDSCWGFDDSKYAIEEAKSCIDFMIKKQQEDQAKQLKAYITHKVPLDKRTPAKV